jgi:hypothetical protein
MTKQLPVSRTPLECAYSHRRASLLRGRKRCAVGRRSRMASWTGLLHEAHPNTMTGVRRSRRRGGRSPWWQRGHVDAPAGRHPRSEQRSPGGGGTPKSATFRRARGGWTAIAAQRTRPLGTKLWRRRESNPARWRPIGRRRALARGETNRRRPAGARSASPRDSTRTVNGAAARTSGSFKIGL